MNSPITATARKIAAALNSVLSHRSAVYGSMSDCRTEPTKASRVFFSVISGISGSVRIVVADTQIAGTGPNPYSFRRHFCPLSPIPYPLSPIPRPVGGIYRCKARLGDWGLGIGDRG